MDAGSGEGRPERGPGVHITADFQRNVASCSIPHDADAPDIECSHRTRIVTHAPILPLASPVATGRMAPPVVAGVAQPILFVEV